MANKSSKDRILLEDGRLQIGDKIYDVGEALPDKWTYLGPSPDTGKPYSLEPVESALDGAYTWDEGEKHAADLRKQGHAKARQPSDTQQLYEPDERSELFDIFNKIVNGGRNDVAKLDTRFGNPDGKYWSSAKWEEMASVKKRFASLPSFAGSSPKDKLMPGARFFGSDDGHRVWDNQDGKAHVRCVRNEPVKINKFKPAAVVAAKVATVIDTTDKREDAMDMDMMSRFLMIPPLGPAPNMNLYMPPPKKRSVWPISINIKFGRG